MRFCKSNIMALFKYYSCKKHNISAVSQGQIFFSLPSGLNDCFDVNPASIPSFKSLCERIDCSEDEMSKRLAEHAVCCFTKGERADNKHLWTFYASNFEGFAIEFDEKVIGNLTKYYAKPLPLYDVDYRDAPINLAEDDPFAIKETLEDEEDQLSVNKCIEDYVNGDKRSMDRLFLELHLQKERSMWQIESECRLILAEIILKNKKGFIKRNRGYLLKLPSYAMKSIIIGSRASNKSHRRLMKIAHKYSLPSFSAIPLVEDNKWKIVLKKIL